MEQGRDGRGDAPAQRGPQGRVLHMIDQKPDLAIEELGPGVLEMDATNSDHGPRPCGSISTLEAREATKVLAPPMFAGGRSRAPSARASRPRGACTAEPSRSSATSISTSPGPRKGTLPTGTKTDVAVFHADVYGVQAKSGDIFHVIGSEGEKVLLQHPDGKTRRADPSKYLRYRVDLFETEGNRTPCRGEDSLDPQRQGTLPPQWRGGAGPLDRSEDPAASDSRCRTLTLGHDDPQLHFIRPCLDLDGPMRLRESPAIR